MLLTALLLGLVATNTFAQQRTNDVFPKGEFTDAYTPPSLYQKISSIYTSDTGTMSNDWKSTSFSQQKTKKGKSLYGTGTYAANAQLSTTSPSILLPSVGKNERLILQLTQSYEVENNYDFISVWVLENGTETEVYRRSGKTNEVDDHINLTAYAGKRIELSFRLMADDSYEGTGWSIVKIDLYNATKSQTQTKGSASTKTRPTLRGGGNHSLDILSVNTETFPNAIFIEFTVKDGNGNFVDSLTLDDFTVTDDYSPRIGCTKLLKVSEGMKEAVDIVFLVDNSGSMSDDIAKIQNAITAFLPQLEGKCDARVGLLRFGQYPEPPCPNYATIESGAQFFYNLDTAGIRSFLTDIWSRNEDSGAYEPYYEVLNWAANQPLAYRPNAKKVFIMIGDERVNDNYNNYQCNHTTASSLTATGVANTLNQKGIQAFFIWSMSYAGDVAPIAAATGGLIENIYQNTYDDILDNFSQAMTEKYILRYCLDTDPATVNPTVSHIVEVTYNAAQVSDTISYFPISSPNIVRSLATQTLDNTTQPDNVAVTVEATVVLNGNTLNYIDFYYKQYNDTYITVRKTAQQGTAVGSNIVFTFTIPAGAVQDPLVEYYFKANTTFNTGSSLINKEVSSPPYNPDFFAWTFAVMPNFPPKIDTVTMSVQNVVPCKQITVCATVTDNTQSIDGTPTLYFRTKGTPSIFLHENMQPIAPNSHRYCATIPASVVQVPGIEYYIVAKDNYGTLGLYGTVSQPKEINISAQPLSSSYPCYVMVGYYANIEIECEPLQTSDTIEVYFTNDCGELQLSSRFKWNGVGSSLMFPIYGDDNPNDDYKNGFYDGELVQFKLIRNGIDYGLATPPVYYNSQGTPILITAASGATASAVSIKGNNIVIQHNDITPSVADSTDFEISSVPVTKTFSITNTGCDRLLVKSIALSDNANFSATMPNNTLIAPGYSENFTITYQGLASANATVTVSTNAATKNPYKFNIKGDLAVANPCDGITVFNPITSAGSVVLFDVPTNGTNVEIYLTSIAGVYIKQFYQSLNSPAGQGYALINSSGVTPGVYFLIVKRNNTICSTPVIFQ